MEISLIKKNPEGLQVINYEILRNKVYKLLPIYEGKNKEHDVLINPNKALENFNNNLDILLVQLNGLIKDNDLDYHDSLNDVIVMLRGLTQISISQHKLVRNVILKCTTELDKIK